MHGLGAPSGKLRQLGVPIRRPFGILKFPREWSPRLRASAHPMRLGASVLEIRSDEAATCDDLLRLLARPVLYFDSVK